jgi:hypothetical protein
MAYQLKVSGTDIAGITVAGGRVVLQEWPGIMAKQIEVSLPKLSASTWPDLVGIVTPRPFSVGLVLVGDTAPAFNSLYDAVAAVVQTTATVTLTRVRDLVGSTETKTAKAIYLGGLEPTMQSHAAAKCVPRWQLLAEWA